MRGVAGAHTFHLPCRRVGPCASESPLEGEREEEWHATAGLTSAYAAPPSECTPTMSTSPMSLACRSALACPKCTMSKLQRAGRPAGLAHTARTSVHAVQSHEPAVGPDAHLTLLLRVRLLLSPARLLRSPARPRAAAFRRCRHCKGATPTN